jgi:hypothetical protein
MNKQLRQRQTTKHTKEHEKAKVEGKADRRPGEREKVASLKLEVTTRARISNCG